MLLVAGVPLARPRAQEATPVIADPALAALVAEHNVAWASGDPDLVIALYAEDALFEEIILGHPVARGHDEMSAYVGAVFDAFTSFAITVTDGFAAGDRVALEWVLTGAYTGQFATLPPGSGQAVEVRGASIIELDGDRIAYQAEYWDLAVLLSQVGALPEQAAVSVPCQPCRHGVLTTQDAVARRLGTAAPRQPVAPERYAVAASKALPTGSRASTSSSRSTSASVL